MNCKPNDLAIVVGVDSADVVDSLPNEYGVDAFKMLAIDIRGTIVKCIKSTICETGDVLWEIEERRVRFEGIMNDGSRIAGTGVLYSVPDRILRPLRGGDLGEDVFSEEPIDSDVILIHNTTTQHRKNYVEVSHLSD